MTADPPTHSDIADAFDAPTDGLRGRAKSGVIKVGLAQGVRLAVQFGSVIVLSRLLPPAEFGILAMAGPIVSFATLFQDLGLTQAVVQKPSLTQSEVSALFGVSLGTSLAIALLLLAAAPLAAAFYHEPRVGFLTAAMGVNVLLGGAGSIHYALLNRRMQFDALALIDALAAILGLIAAILGALVLHSVWALYVGNLVAASVPPAGYWMVSAWRPSMPHRRSGVGSALRFGANVTGFNIGNFFARNLDNVLIGRVWGDRPLGIYDRAYKLLLMPLQQINNPISKVLLPVLSQLAAEPARYRAAFLQTQAQILLVTLPGVAFMVGTADLLIPRLLGAQWAEAAPIFAALGLASLPQSLNNPSGWLFITQGRTRQYAYWGVVGSTMCIVSFLVGLPYGPMGVAVSYTVNEYLQTPLVWWYVTRTGPVRLSDIVAMAWPHYLGALASLAAVAGLRRMLAGAPPVPVLAAALATSFIASGCVLAASAHGRDTFRHSLGLLHRRR